MADEVVSLASTWLFSLEISYPTDQGPNVEVVLIPKCIYYNYKLGFGEISTS